MDQLVRQYTRSPHQNEFYSEQEQHDLTEALPPLSLKFSLPPVANVSYSLLYDWQLWLLVLVVSLQNYPGPATAPPPTRPFEAFIPAINEYGLTTEN
jgi:hypothetical protein